ncbi:MAG: helix-turn-helix domain-containing protein [Planctomycetota bacterium]
MARKIFAKALRQARLKAGLSQAELAAKVGLTGSYISQLESGQRRPLIPRRVEALCKAVGIPSGPLQEAAAMERSSPTIRKKLEGLDRERAKVRRVRDRLLVAALHEAALHGVGHDDLEASGDLEPEVRRHLLVAAHRAKGLGDVRRAEEEAPRILEGTVGKQRDAMLRALPRVLETLRARRRAGPADAAAGPLLAIRRGLDARSGEIGRRVVDPGDGVGPDAWFVVADDDDAHPRVEAGDLLLVDPALDPETGDLVVLLHEGRVRVRRYMPQGSAVRLEALRPDVPPIRPATGATLVVVRRIERALR